MQENKLPHNHHNQPIEQTLSKIASLDDFQMTADIFKQLSDPTRLRIFWLLCHNEECVLNIASIMKMSSPAVAHHLKQLKTYSLIESHRKGKEMYYKASSTKESILLHHFIDSLMDVICPNE